MEEKRVLCFACKKMRNEEIVMIEKHDMLVCPKCQTSMLMEGKSPLGRYVDIWKSNAEELFPILRPEMTQQELANTRLFFLYEDCYHTLLIGRHNASIILMGVLLEALMKERILLKLGIDFHQPYGPCLKIIKEKKLMEPEHIKFLEKFKDEIRNLYQHADEQAILSGYFTPVWPIQFVGEPSLEKLGKFLEDAKSGRLKPKLIPAANHPVIRSIVKQTVDRQKSIRLFNQVYDFLLETKIKYFKQEEYDEYHKKFGTPTANIEHYNL